MYLIDKNSHELKEGGQMDYLIVIARCFLTVFEYFSFYYVLFGRRLRSWQSVNKKILLFAIFFMCSLVVELSFHKDLFFLKHFTFIFLPYLLFDINWKELIRLNLLIYPIRSIFENVINYFLCIFVEFNENILELIYIACLIFLLWFYYILVGRRINKDAFMLNSRIWVFVAGIIWIIAAMTTYFGYVLIYIYLPNAKVVGDFLLIFGNIAICIFIFGMIYYINVTGVYKIEMDAIEKFNEQQKDYFTQLLKREQDTRRFRHDLNNELIELRFFCENKDYANLENYLAQMMDEFQTIRGRYYDVGSDIANTILNYYLIPINHECKVSVQGYMSDQIRISQRDICILVSNLVKNAVEAVQRCVEREKRIAVRINQGEKFLTVSVKNTLNRSEIIMQNGILVTVKEDKRNHGFGTQNIQMVVNKYDGIYDQKIEDGEFIVTVQLRL